MFVSIGNAARPTQEADRYADRQAGSLPTLKADYQASRQAQPQYRQTERQQPCPSCSQTDSSPTHPAGRQASALPALQADRQHPIPRSSLVKSRMTGSSLVHQWCTVSCRSPEFSRRQNSLLFMIFFVTLTFEVL